MNGNYSYSLIVDDQAGVRRLIYEILTDDGYNVEMAASGQEALLRVRSRAPSLVILDVKMPGMGGLETLVEIKKIAPEVPVVMISAYGELDIIMEAKRRGLTQYHLWKPFDLNEMRKLVNNILAEKKNYFRELDQKKDIS